MSNHLRNEIKRNKVKKKKLKEKKLKKKEQKKQREKEQREKEQSLFTLFSDNGKRIMYKLVFTNGESTRIYSKIESVLEDVKSISQCHTNYRKTPYIPTYIISECGNKRLKTFNSNL
jgi:hypothetical protein